MVARLAIGFVLGIGLTLAIRHFAIKLQAWQLILETEQAINEHK